MNEGQKDTILIADDNPNNLRVLSETLEKFGYQVRVATNGRTALASAEADPPDLMLLDIHMPEMDGYEVCKNVRANPSLADIPILFVSAMNEEFNKVRGFELGGDDYLTKPIQLEETHARVKVHLRLRKKIHELEQFNKAMIGRELRIVELKKEVNALSRELGRKTPYREGGGE